jgi:hypothetical protein
MSDYAYDIIDLYNEYKDKQDIENLVNCALSLYYDDTLQDMFPYVMEKSNRKNLLKTNSYA